MPKVEPIPTGMPGVTPHLVIDGASEALDFYARAFGAVVEVKMPGPDGKLMHGMMRINGSPVMVVDQNPQWGAMGPRLLKGTPVTLHLYVTDADAFAAHAEKAGCKVKMPVQEMFWGDRYGVLEDPYGHSWSVATHVKELSPEEMKKAMDAACA